MIAHTLSGRRLVKRGRPTKLDERTTNAIVAAVRAKATRAEAAKAAGISRSTLQAWLAEGRDGSGGYEALLSAVRLAERFPGEHWLSFEERWEERRRAALPVYARLGRSPDARARRLARKRAGRARAEPQVPGDAPGDGLGMPTGET